jgi:uncharacterized protein (DUF952 family)
MILHITTLKEWEIAQTEGEYTTSSLESEGFIHCSSLKQVADTANIVFKGRTDLILLLIDENKLKYGIRYESPTYSGHHGSGNGDMFPHVYGPLNLSAVIKVIDFPPDKNGLFSIPEELTI